MVRFPKMLISFLFLLVTSVASAQAPANRPSSGKIIECRLAENRKWQISQLPQNSILFKYQTSVQAPTFSYQFKKEKFPSMQFALPVDSTHVPPGTFLQPLLKQNREKQNQSQKIYWWNEKKVIRGNESAPVKTNNYVLTTSN